MPKKPKAKRGKRSSSSALQRGNHAFGRVFSMFGSPPNFQNDRYDGQVYRVRQMRSFGSHSTSASVVTSLGVSVQINGLTNVAALAATFDQYRILEAEFWIMPRTAAVNANLATSNTGRLSSVIDYTDSGALATEADALAYNSCITSSGADGHYRRWKPSIAVAALQSGSSGVTNVGMTDQWLDSAELDTDHFGLKFLSTVTDIVYIFDLYLRITSEWRNQG